MKKLMIAICSTMVVGALNYTSVFAQASDCQPDFPAECSSQRNNLCVQIENYDSLTTLIAGYRRTCEEIGEYCGSEDEPGYQECLDDNFGVYQNDCARLDELTGGLTIGWQALTTADRQFTDCRDEYAGDEDLTSENDTMELTNDTGSMDADDTPPIQSVPSDTETDELETSGSSKVRDRRTKTTKRFGSKRTSSSNSTRRPVSTRRRRK